MLDNVDDAEGATGETRLAEDGRLFGEAERLNPSCLNISRFLVRTVSPGMLPDNSRLASSAIRETSVAQVPSNLGTDV